MPTGLGCADSSFPDTSGVQSSVIPVSRAVKRCETSTPSSLQQAWSSVTGSRDQGITSSACSSRTCCHVLFQAVATPDRGKQPTRFLNVVQQCVITPWSLSPQNPSHSPSPSCITEHRALVPHFHWHPSIPALGMTLNQDTGKLPESLVQPLPILDGARHITGLLLRWWQWWPSHCGGSCGHWHPTH